MAEAGDWCFIFFDPQLKNSMIGEFVRQDATSISVYEKQQLKQINYKAIRGGIFTCQASGECPSVQQAREILKMRMQSTSTESFVSIDLETGSVLTGEW